MIKLANLDFNRIVDMNNYFNITLLSSYLIKKDIIKLKDNDCIINKYDFIFNYLCNDFLSHTTFICHNNFSFLPEDKQKKINDVCFDLFVYPGQIANDYFYDEIKEGSMKEFREFEELDSVLKKIDKSRHDEFQGIIDGEIDYIIDSFYYPAISISSKKLDLFLEKLLQNNRYYRLDLDSVIKRLLLLLALDQLNISYEKETTSSIMYLICDTNELVLKHSNPRKQGKKTIVFFLTEQLEPECYLYLNEEIEDIENFLDIYFEEEYTNAQTCFFR